MGYTLEFNCLLRIPEDTLDLTSLQVGARYQLVKDDARLYPVDIPIEICDANYVYYGKVAVRKLSLSGSKTELEIEVLKVFNAQERDIYTKNFIQC